MTSFIYSKGASHYFRCKTADGGRVHESLTKRFGTLSGPQVELLTLIIDSVRALPPVSKPGPKSGTGSPTPNGLKRCTPEEAAEIAWAALRQDVEDGIFQPSSETQRKSQINTALGGLGRKAWTRWMTWNSWLIQTQKYPRTTRTNYTASARYLICKCKDAGYFVPNFVEESPAVKMTPSLSRAIRKGQPSRRAPKETYSIDEMRSVLRAASDLDEIYLRLMYSIIGYAGMSPVDANYLLAGKYDEGEGFNWKRGTYSYLRTKSEQESMEVRTIPLAPSLLALLEPFKVGKRGIRIPSSRPHHDWHNRTANSVRDNWKRLEESVGIETVKGHVLKRLRHTFHVNLRKRFALRRTERYHLMGWAYTDKSERINSHYDEIDWDACVEAVAKWDALMTGEGE